MARLGRALATEVGESQVWRRLPNAGEARLLAVGTRRIYLRVCAIDS
jgi:hypothetical protein